MTNRPLLVVAFLFASILLLIAFLVYRFGREISFVGLFVLAVALGALSRIPDRFSGKSSGIDVGVFFVICILLSWGSSLAILAGVLINIAAFFVAKDRPQDTFAAMVMMSVTVLAGGLLPNLGILFSGMLLVLFYDVLCILIYPFLGHTIEGNLRFAFVHLVWNYALFSALGTYVVHLFASVA